MTDLFILCALFFPRVTLIFLWLMHDMPQNSTPFILDVIATIFCPRLLVAFWLYEANFHPLLVLIFVVFGVMELLGAGRTASKD